jgi:hypothetical protein
MPTEQIRPSAIVEVFPNILTERALFKTPTVPFRNCKQNQEQGQILRNKHLQQIFYAYVRDEGTDTRLRTNDRFSIAVYKQKLLRVENSEGEVEIRWRYIHSNTVQPQSSCSW